MTRSAPIERHVSYHLLMPVDTELLARVLDLPSDDRAQLAREILLSLESSGFDADEDVQEAWNAELEDRIAEYERGEVDALDWREAL
jgi:putative addiction module component (TIGR02574 family)